MVLASELAPGSRSSSLCRPFPAGGAGGAERPALRSAPAAAAASSEAAAAAAAVGP